MTDSTPKWEKDFSGEDRLRDNTTNVTGTFLLFLPEFEDWEYGYRVDPHSTCFYVELDAVIYFVQFKDRSASLVDEEEAARAESIFDRFKKGKIDVHQMIAEFGDSNGLPTVEENHPYLSDLERQEVNVRINSPPKSNEIGTDANIEQTRGKGCLGHGQRADEEMWIDIWLKRSEFRDMLDVSRQNHLRRDLANHEEMRRNMDPQVAELAQYFEQEGHYVFSRNPRIRIEINNIVSPDDPSKKLVWFRVSSLEVRVGLTGPFGPEWSEFLTK